MKTAQIVHNPTSGDGEHSKKDILKFIKQGDYEINYTSTHDLLWEKFMENDADVIFLAGGDGTVHKLAAVLLDQKDIVKLPPVYLLPMGTANNIAKTLQLEGRNLNGDLRIPEKIINFDHGLIKGIHGIEFFIESVGIGIFPKLIKEMKNEKELDDPEEKLKHTIHVLQKIVGDFQAEEAEITIDGEAIRGSYLMVEVMNIKYIGPNLKVAPHAKPEDGLLDVVLVPVENREKILNYLEDMAKGKVEDAKVDQFGKTYKAKKVSLKYKGENLHVDDDFIEDFSGEEIQLETASGGLKFFSEK
ncbi:diacylglycerol/lipid kinase family protein [Salinimicrobium sp. GXAS 041]|uniref:diacylglycerol/lipid kinase family protein n=1 Tax=Salinimicrobium sp. GXAS 041 TaxID=3400806 RepID=UPI003C734BE1